MIALFIFFILLLITIIFVYPFIEIIIVGKSKILVEKKFIIDNPNLIVYPTYMMYKYTDLDPNGIIFSYMEIKPFIKRFGIYINVKVVDSKDLKKFNQDELIDLKDSHNYGKSKKSINKFKL